MKLWAVILLRGTMSQHLMILFVGEMVVFVGIAPFEGFRVVSVDFLEFLKCYEAILVGVHDPETDMVLFLRCLDRKGCGDE